MNQMTIGFLQNHMTTLCSSILMGSTPGTSAFAAWLPDEVARNPAISIFLLQHVVDELVALANDANKPEQTRQRAAAGLQVVDKLYNTGRVQIFSVPQSGQQTGSRVLADDILYVARQFNNCRLAVITQSGALASQISGLNATLPAAYQVQVRRINSHDGALANFLPRNERVAPQPLYRTTPLHQLGCQGTPVQAYQPAPQMQQPVYQPAPPVQQPAYPSTPPVQQPAYQPAPQMQQPAYPSAPQGQRAYQPAPQMQQPMPPKPAPQMQQPAYPSAPQGQRAYQPAPQMQQPMPPKPAPPKPVLTTLSKTPATLPSVREDSVLNGSDGKKYTLDELLDAGAESLIYTVKGHPELVCKVLTSVTERKLAKIRRLCQLPRINGAVLPVCTVEKDGTTVGYLMPRLSDAIPLIVLGTDSGLKREASHFTRKDFITIAVRMVNISQQLMQQGVMYADFSLTNIMVGRDADGKLNADNISFIDMDSAQITMPCAAGATRCEVIPGDGLTLEFISPRLCMTGYDEDTLRTTSDYQYILTLMAITIVLGVQHPFLALSSGQDYNLQDAICHGRFPLDRLNTMRSPLAYIFSYMTPGIKAVAGECFTASASVDKAAAAAALAAGKDPFEGRFPTVGKLLDQLRYYGNWVTHPSTLARFKEALSLNPTAPKPYVKPGQQASAPAPRPAAAQPISAPLPRPAAAPPASAPRPMPARDSVLDRVGNFLQRFIS